MAWNKISGTVPQFTTSGEQANGYVIKFYQTGTTTPLAVATDDTGGTTATNFPLNTQGYATHSGAEIIPHVDQDYKLVLYTSQADADANNTGSAVYVVDNIQGAVATAGGIGLTELYAIPDANVIIGGTTANGDYPLSGDVTMTNTGVVSVSSVQTNAVDTAGIQASAVTTAKIADLNVTEGKLSAAVQAKLTGGTGNGSDIYRGRVTNNGTATFVSGSQPSGWTVSRTALGLVRITHNLGTTNYSCVPVTTASARYMHIDDHQSNYIDVYCKLISTSAGSDQDFEFILIN